MTSRSILAIVEQPELSPALKWCETSEEAEQWLVQYRRDNLTGFGTRYVIAKCLWNIME